MSHLTVIKIHNKSVRYEIFILITQTFASSSAILSYRPYSLCVTFGDWSTIFRKIFVKNIPNAGAAKLKVKSLLDCERRKCKYTKQWTKVPKLRILKKHCLYFICNCLKAIFDPNFRDLENCG